MTPPATPVALVFQMIPYCCFLQRIVQEHGGHVTVDSHLGHGTTFTVRLPVQAVSP